MKKFLPKTIASQLIAILLLVMVIGQGFNLWIIIGESRIQTRAAIFKAIMESAVDRAPSLSEIETTPLPFAVPNRKSVPGSFFFSRNNRASLMAGTKHLPKYEGQYETMLREAGFEPKTVLVVLQSGVLGTKGRAVPSGPHREGENRRPPRPNRQGGRPPPRRGARQQGDNRPPGMFHPKPPRAKGNAPAMGMQDLFLSAEIAPGIWYNAMVPHYSLEALLSRIILATAIWAFLTLLAVWFFTRRITKPLAALTSAANKLGRGENTPLLTTRGPSDVQMAAKAFNTMQTRLTRTLETQRAMLRAIGHDLRTPLTSLRIRAENISDPKNKDKIINTLDDMTVMTEEILNWAKDVSGLEENAAVDLTALLSSQADNYSDLGRPVTFEETKPIILHFLRVALSRAVQNLVDNALKYGKTAHISIEQTADKIFIHIDDEGPGIPEDRLEDMRKPFVRLEASRNKATGGIGLGLSISDAIAQSAGGKLILSNRQKGLRATLQLPSAAKD